MPPPLDRTEFERWRAQATSAQETAARARRGGRHEWSGEALGSTWPADVSEPAARLSRHYIPTRYPDAHASGTPGAHYTDADSELAERDLDRVLGAVDRAWSQLGGGG